MITEEFLDGITNGERFAKKVMLLDRDELARYFDEWARRVGVSVRREDGVILLSQNFVLDRALPWSMELTHAQFRRAFGDPLDAMHATWHQVRFLRVLTFIGTVPELPLPETFLRPFVRLEELIVVDVELESLPEVFDGVPALRVFKVVKCRLTALPRTLCACANLEKLIVRHNRINELEPALIARLRKLHKLGFAHNRLEGVAPACFESASPTDSVLRRLNFSYNLLRTFPFSALEHIESLRSVNVSSNVNLCANPDLFERCASPRLRLQITDTPLAITARCKSPRVTVVAVGAM